MNPKTSGSLFASTNWILMMGVVSGIISAQWKHEALPIVALAAILVSIPSKSERRPRVQPQAFDPELPYQLSADVIVLSDVHDCGFLLEQIAAAMHRTKDAVRGISNRARRNLRTLLGHSSRFFSN